MVAFVSKFLIFLCSKRSQKTQSCGSSSMTEIQPKKPGGTKGKLRCSQRSRIDVIACILENADESSKKTRLMCNCNLSHSQFSLYIDCLVEAGLLEVSVHEGGIEIYETTARGRSFMEDWKRIKGYCET